MVTNTLPKSRVGTMVSGERATSRGEASSCTYWLLALGDASTEKAPVIGSTGAGCDSGRPVFSSRTWICIGEPTGPSTVDSTSVPEMRTSALCAGKVTSSFWSDPGERVHRLWFSTDTGGTLRSEL